MTEPAMIVGPDVFVSQQMVEDEAAEIVQSLILRSFDGTSPTNIRDWQALCEKFGAYAYQLPFPHLCPLFTGLLYCNMIVFNRARGDETAMRYISHELAEHILRQEVAPMGYGFDSRALHRVAKSVEGYFFGHLTGQVMAHAV